MSITETAAQSAAGYQTFSIGGFTFVRDEYFATITWPTGTHQIAIDVFLRALQRGVALLLRDRELRRRVRHDEPLRQRRHVRRQVQRRLPAGGGRLQRELHAR